VNIFQIVRPNETLQSSRVSPPRGEASKHFALLLVEWQVASNPFLLGDMGYTITILSYGFLSPFIVLFCGLGFRLEGKGIIRS
jgi:hypothetical protein